MAMITARCWRDPQYRDEFVQDPRRVLTEEGLDVPEGININVVIDSPTDRYLVLPAAPDELTSLTATDSELMQLALSTQPNFTFTTVTVWLYAASVAIAAAGAVATLIIVVT
jgi:hypothetical protein